MGPSSAPEPATTSICKLSRSGVGLSFGWSSTASSLVGDWLRESDLEWIDIIDGVRDTAEINKAIFKVNKRG